MIPIGRELLFPARVLRFRIGSTNIAADDLCVPAQFFKRPLEVGHCESSALPIRHRIFRAQTIEIDCDVNIRAAKTSRKVFKLIAPVFAQDRSATLSIFHRPIVGPRMDFQSSAALSAAISKNIVRPPAFKISATPDRDALHMFELERAIDPTAASPARRSDRPVRMIIERNENDRLDQATKPKRAKIMEIARTVEGERRESRADFVIKLFDESRRRAETKRRSPIACVKRRQLRISPGVVEIKMQAASQKIISASAVGNVCRFVSRREDFPLPQSESGRCATLLHTE